MPELPKPPMAAAKPFSFTLHGTTIEDPYHWLRDENYPEVNNTEILAYLKSENVFFDAYMAPIQPLVNELFSELKDRIPAEDESVPYLKNGYWYQWRFVTGAQYRSWYRASQETPQQWQLLLDECTLAEGHEYFDLGALSISPDTTKLAYSVDTDGSERYVLHCIDITTGDAQMPAIPNTIDDPIWNASSDAFLYVVLNDQWQPLQVFQRLLHAEDEKPSGAQHAADALIYEEADSAFRVSLALSQSEIFAMIISGAHTSNEVYLLPRENLSEQPKLMSPRAESVEYYVDHRRAASPSPASSPASSSGEFFIRSNLRQQNFDLFRTREDQPEQQHWQLWQAGSEHQYLTDHLVLDDYVVIEERIEGLAQIRLIDRADNSHYVVFPEPAYDVSIGAMPNTQAEHLRLHYTSMVTPNTIYDYEIASHTLMTRKVQQIPSGYEASSFITTRLSVPSRDGVHIPVSLVHHRDTPLDGSAPLYLYGYGAYGHAITPYFSSSRISLLERGFVYAIAHIRGGDDLGYHWYTQGKLDKRTNTFNDFVDTARHLIELKYTSSGKIAIAGGSAGGELMGAVVNQAAELWGAVAAHVPFVDVLNTMLDETLPLTPTEWAEWGNPIHDPAAFHHIASYSPYDQLARGAYPPMMVTAGLNDPRVTYWEPAKYVAKLRTVKTDNTILVLKTNMGAGHGGQSGRFEALRELAEEYAFFLNLLAA